MPAFSYHPKGLAIDLIQQLTFQAKAISYERTDQKLSANQVRLEYNLYVGTERPQQYGSYFTHQFCKTFKDSFSGFFFFQFFSVPNMVSSALVQITLITNSTGIAAVCATSNPVILLEITLHRLSCHL